MQCGLCGYSISHLRKRVICLSPDSLCAHRILPTRVLPHAFPIRQVSKSGPSASRRIEPGTSRSCFSPCREGTGCTPRTHISACREGSCCTPRTRFSACREGGPCTPRSGISVCRGGKGCIPGSCFSPSHADTGCTPRSLISACHVNNVFAPCRARTAYRRPPHAPLA